jgi:hypothetical protein
MNIYIYPKEHKFILYINKKLLAGKSPFFSTIILSLGPALVCL